MLLKFPFLVSQMVFFCITFTSPNSVAPQKERIRHRHWLEQYLNTLLAVGGCYALKIIFCMMELAEMAVLLANEFPSHPVSYLILNNLLFPPNPQTAGAMDLTLPALMGSILIMVGGVIRVWCYRSLDHLFTFELSIRENHKLVTTGPYAYVRHPSYSGFLLSFMGVLLVLFGRGGWVRESGVLGTLKGKVAVSLWVSLLSSLVPVLFRRIVIEDKLLKDMFEKEWEDWAEKVPCKLIPGVF